MQYAIKHYRDGNKNNDIINEYCVTKNQVKCRALESSSYKRDKNIAKNKKNI